MMSFNNIQPRTRQERASLRNKEKIEDKFIKERSGDYLHQAEHEKIFTSNKQSTHFITETDRFDRDFLIEQKKEKETKLEKLGKQIEKKREYMIDRENQRWKLMDEEKKKEEERLFNIQENHIVGKKNFNSAAYNPISLEYDKNKGGDALKMHDQVSQQKAQVRSKNIDDKSNSKFNILTGEERAGIKVQPIQQNKQ